MIGKQIDVTKQDGGSDGGSSGGGSDGSGTTTTQKTDLSQVQIVIADELGIVPFTILASLAGLILSDIVTAIWNYGDGTTGSGSPKANVSHTYQQSGSYKLSVELYGVNGLISTLIYPSYIVVSPKGSTSTPVVPSIKILSQSGTLPLTLQTLIQNAPEDVENVQWNFGDGTTVNNDLVPVSHIYNNEGSYFLSVVLLHNDGSQTTVNYPSPIVVSLQEQTTKTASFLSSPVAIILMAGAAVGILFSSKKKRKGKGK